MRITTTRPRTKRVTVRAPRKMLPFGGGGEKVFLVTLFLFRLKPWTTERVVASGERDALEQVRSAFPRHLVAWVRPEKE